MRKENYFRMTRLFVFSFVLATSLTLAGGQAMAQKPSEAQVEDALYKCLQRALGLKTDEERNIRDPLDHTRAFDPKSQRNFFYDKDKHAWRDQTYMTLPGNHPPLSTTDFVTLDQGERPQPAQLSPARSPRLPGASAVVALNTAETAAAEIECQYTICIRVRFFSLSKSIANFIFGDLRRKCLKFSENAWRRQTELHAAAAQQARSAGEEPPKGRLRA